MKLRSVLIVILQFLALCCFSQMHYISLKDADFYEKSEKKMLRDIFGDSPKYVLRDSLATGIWVLYDTKKDINGKPQEEMDTLATGEFTNGVKNGTFRYRINEESTLIVNYLNGQLHGFTGIVSLIDYSIKQSVTYQFGRRHGIAVQDLGPLGADYVFYKNDEIYYKIFYHEPLNKSVPRTPSPLLVPINGTYDLMQGKGNTPLLSLKYENGQLSEVTSFYEEEKVKETAVGINRLIDFADFSDISYLEHYDIFANLQSGVFIKYDRQGNIAKEIKKID